MAAEVVGERKVRIVSVETKQAEGVRYGFVEQPSRVAFTINELARLLQNSAHLPEVKTLCVSLNAKTMKQVPFRLTRPVGSGRRVTPELLEEIDSECYISVRQPDVMVYDAIPLHYELDGIRMDDPEGERGNELTVYYNLIVGNADIKQELERCFVRTQNLTLDPYMPLGVEALSEVLLTDEEREAGCALINLGATTTTLAVYAQGVLQQLLVVPLGGKNITHDIRELGISQRDAERLKCLKGSALRRMVGSPIRIQIPSSEAGAPPVKIDTDFLATVIEMRLTEMMTPIFKALTETPFEIAAGIVLSGGGAKLHAVADFVEEKTGLPVRLGSHAAHLSDDTDKRFSDPVFSQQIGTVLLLHDYTETNRPTQEPEPVKTPKTTKSNSSKTFADKTRTWMRKLFEDDNYLK